VPGLVARSHDLAFLHLDPTPVHTTAVVKPRLALFSIGCSGVDQTIKALQEWNPDICFSHNMRALGVDRRLALLAPVVKFMHGYFGTCIGGQKMFGQPTVQPCGRTFGAPCLALYLPRRCGQVGLPALARHYLWAREQRDLFVSYRAIIVASQHMKREFVRNGVDVRRVHVNPLFSDQSGLNGGAAATRPLSVVFIGRMTKLKGGNLLVRAVADASSRLGTPIELTMVGDGPQRADWERLAARLDVRATFVGWKSGDERWQWVRHASLLAVPSVWPEPFGLVGLEAAALGVPAIAFDVGGFRDWLTPGENGYLVAGDPPRASALADGLVDAFRHPDELQAMRCKASAVARRMSLGRHLDRLEEVFCARDASRADSAGR
jgi:glycosyltransferase involved in cell wall biosynthesis